MDISFIIERIFKGENYTIGKLYYLEGKQTYICDTLEDRVRIPFIKIPKQTAIRSGSYKMILDMSKRFKCIMPHILNVKDFEGIRIHAGNDHEDTEGCILLGINTIKGKVTNSKECFKKFMKLLEEHTQKEYDLTIE